MAVNAALRERCFAEAKRLCYAGLDGPTLLGEVAERLRRVVPFETYCSQSNDPPTGLLTYVGHDGVLSEKEQRIYLEHVFFEEDLDAQRKMVRNRVQVALVSEVTGGKIERAMRCREITLPIGLGYELVGICAVGQEHWGGMTLMREAGRPDFEPRETELLRRIVPHLGAGLKAAVLRKEASVESEAESAPGVLVLDDRGRVVQHTKSAERWLRDLGDLGDGWRDGYGLPAPVWMATGALRRALKTGPDRDLNGVPSIRVQARSGRWLTFHGARAESSPGRGERRW